MKHLTITINNIIESTRVDNCCFLSTGRVKSKYKSIGRIMSIKYQHNNLKICIGTITSDRNRRH